MSSSPDVENSSPGNKTCSICLANIRSGQAIFTAECSHSFHFPCIVSSVTHGNYLCPVCRAKWNDLPFPKPNSNTFPGRVFPQYNPSSYVPRRQLPAHSPAVTPEPTHFSDDEPLPEVTVDSTSSSSSSSVRPQNVNIKVIPERPAIVASESILEFDVLVSLQAPPLLGNERAPVDLVTVLDVSGSMAGNKLALLKRAVCFVIDNLSPSDRLSIVSFSSNAQRIFSLRRMTSSGREDAKQAVNLLVAGGLTNIVEALKKGVQVLEERRQHNPVASIIFLSDGRDTVQRGQQFQTSSNSSEAPAYTNLFPSSICPRNREETQDESQQPPTIPVHTFGFGSDHDPVVMHAISDASGGTFSFIESFEVVQDAFASCIGGLLSVVVQELQLIVKSASPGVEIKSIPSGRYVSIISDQGRQGIINVGDLYADEEKDFLINLSVPVHQVTEDEGGSQRKTPLLSIGCSYKDVVSTEMVMAGDERVEILRPEVLSLTETSVNVEVDRQRNRLLVAEGIVEAQQMAEAGNLRGARDVLSNRRSTLLSSISVQEGDGLSNWLASELAEMEQRMGNREIYNRAGRAYALSGRSSHARQRASTRGSFVPSMGAAEFGESNAGFGACSTIAEAASYSAYVTPNMANMVMKSKKHNNTESSSTDED